MLLTEIEVSVCSYTATNDLGLFASVQYNAFTPWRISASVASSGFCVKVIQYSYKPSIHLLLPYASAGSWGAGAYDQLMGSNLAILSSPMHFFGLELMHADRACFISKYFVLNSVGINAPSLLASI